MLPTTFGSSNKRGLDEDEVDDDALLEDMQAGTADRVFARPRGRGKPTTSRGQALVAGPAGLDGGSDFGEAEFLRPGDEMEF